VRSALVRAGESWRLAARVVWLLGFLREAPQPHWQRQMVRIRSSRGLTQAGLGSKGLELLARGCLEEPSGPGRAGITRALLEAAEALAAGGGGAGREAAPAEAPGVEASEPEGEVSRSGASGALEQTLCKLVRLTQSEQGALMAAEEGAVALCRRVLEESAANSAGSMSPSALLSLQLLAQMAQQPATGERFASENAVATLVEVARTDCAAQCAPRAPPGLSSVAPRAVALGALGALCSTSEACRIALLHTNALEELLLYSGSPHGVEVRTPALLTLAVLARCEEGARRMRLADGVPRIVAAGGELRAGAAGFFALAALCNMVEVEAPHESETTALYVARCGGVDLACDMLARFALRGGVPETDLRALGLLGELARHRALLPRLLARRVPELCAVVVGDPKGRLRQRVLALRVLEAVAGHGQRRCLAYLYRIGTVGLCTSACQVLQPTRERAEGEAAEARSLGFQVLTHLAALQPAARSMTLSAGTVPVCLRAVFASSMRLLTDITEEPLRVLLALAQWPCQRALLVQAGVAETCLAVLALDRKLVLTATRVALDLLRYLARCRANRDHLRNVGLEDTLATLVHERPGRGPARVAEETLANLRRRSTVDLWTMPKACWRATLAALLPKAPPPRPEQLALMAPAS
jgi:hypothetical protein